MTLEEFKNACKKRNIELTEAMINQLNLYAEYLEEYNENINLTAITE